MPLYRKFSLNAALPDVLGFTVCSCLASRLYFKGKLNYMRFKAKMGRANINYSYLFTIILVKNLKESNKLSSFISPLIRSGEKFGILHICALRWVFLIYFFLFSQYISSLSVIRRLLSNYQITKRNQTSSMALNGIIYLKFLLGLSLVSMYIDHV